MTLNDNIKTFMSSINKIEGPMFAALLTPKSEYSTFPVILNLGDHHIGQDFCNPSCHTIDNCLSLESYSFFDALSTFASENDIIVDIFLETWGLKDYYLSDRSALVNMVGNISELKTTFENTIHFHFVDTRLNYDKKRKADGIITAFFRFLIEIGKERNFHEKIESWFVEQGKHFPGFDRENLINSMIDILNIVSLDDYFEIPLIKEFSRTYHEFKQVPKEVQQRLLHENLVLRSNEIRREKKELIKLLNELINNDTTIEADYYPKLTDNNEQGDLNQVNNSFLLDIYTICRILKKNAKRKFVIIFSGEAHREEIQKLLKQFYNSENIYREISPKCIEKGADDDTAEIVNRLYNSPLTIKPDTPKIWLDNSNGTSLLEMAFSSYHISNEQYVAKNIVENMDNNSLLNFRSSKNSSIFDLTVENNLDDVLFELVTKIPKNQVPNGLIIKTLFHFANSCLRVLCNKKYDPIESVKISGTTVNSLVAAIYLNNDEGVKILSRAINNHEFIKNAVAVAKNLRRNKTIFKS